MIGSLIGSQISALIGSVIGSNGNDEGPGSASVDMLVGIIGQSNSTGEANYGATGSFDTSYGISNTIAFNQVLLDAQWANGGFANPIVWSNLNKTGLVAYAPIGQANMGIEQSLGRYLVKYGIATKPGIIKFGVLGTSLQNHWLPSANVPTIGGKLADQCITYLLQRQALFGRQLDVLIWIQGETDATDSTSATNYQTNLGTLFTYIRSGLGLPNLPIIVQGINTTSSAAFRSTVAAAQVAYVASDSNSRLLPVFDVRLDPDPHYDPPGYIACGDMNAELVASILKPGLNTNIGSGPAPYYQQADAGYSCIANGTITVREGAKPKVGDYELLIVRSGTIATVHALTTAAGFVNIVPQFTSTFSTNLQTMSVWARQVDAPTLAANGGRMPNPTVSPGAATLHVSRIITIRGANAVTPLSVFSVGTNNANTNSVVIGGSTTTANNSLLLIITASAGANQSVSSITNAAFSNIQVIWDGTYNPGAGVTHLAIATATMSVAGIFGTTTVGFANLNNNVGAIIAVSP